MFKNILFVCVGNICRSPTAEYWARSELMKAGKTDIHLSSAGLSAMKNHPIEPAAQAILTQQGVDASAHIARQIDKNIVQSADIIFVMELWQKKELSVVFPGSHGKIFALGQWRNEEVIDPYRKGEAVFETVFELIKDNWTMWQHKLWN